MVRLLTLALIAFVSLLPVRSPSAQSEPDPYAAILPEQRAGVIIATSGRLARYRIVATIGSGGDEEPATVSGELTVALPPSVIGDAVSLPFRLYPDDPVYGPGDIAVDEVTVDGSPVAPRVGAEPSVVWVPLPASSRRGGEVTVAMRFETVVPVRSAASFGIFSTQPDAGSMALAHWYPLLAGRTSAGWDVGPVSANGDPVFTNAALYDLSLDLRGDLVLVAPGVEIEAAADGDRVTRRFVTGPVREAALAVDDDWTAAEAMVNGTRVVAYAEPANAAGRDLALDAAVAALDIFSRRYGPYPFRQFTVVEMALSDAIGMEYSQVVLINDGVIARGGDGGDEARFLEFVVAHEVAHQWWYGLVENDQQQTAFIDEGLAEHAAAYTYFADRYGPTVAAAEMERRVGRWYRQQMATGGDLVVDQPTDDFPDRAAYAAAVYAKAALGFDAIRDEIGDEAFYAALRGIVADYRFAVVDAAAVRAAFDASCRCDIGSTWSRWFRQRAGLPESQGSGTGAGTPHPAVIAAAIPRVRAPARWRAPGGRPANGVSRAGPVPSPP